MVERDSNLHRPSSIWNRATGALIEMTGVDVYEFAGDLVCRVVTETDTMPLLSQIGAVPAPQPSQ
jgi:hypothetical protein